MTKGELKEIEDDVRKALEEVEKVRDAIQSQAADRASAWLGVVLQRIKDVAAGLSE